MTRLKDIEEHQSSDEDNSRAYSGTRSTEHLPSQGDIASSDNRLKPGSSHTKITIVAPDDPVKTWKQTRKHSPPPHYNKEGGWGGDVTNDLSTEFETWEGAPMSLLEDELNEKLWWNPHNREALKPLGPGMLPVLAASKIHDEEHELLSVSVSVPEYAPFDSEGTSYQPPTLDEVREAVPHPNAYYCAKCNGWVIVSKSRTTNPPVYPHYKDDCPELNFPEHRSLQKEVECNSDLPLSSYNPSPDKTHHYHLYEDAIPAISLQTPFVRGDFEPAPPPPRKVCRHVIGQSEEFWKNPLFSMMEIDTEVLHPELIQGVDYLDLYACCQCMTNICVTKRPIPGVVSARLLADLQRERTSGPDWYIKVPVAIEFLVKMIEMVLWQRDSRLILFDGKSFQRSFGEDAQALQIWETLGYRRHEDGKHFIPPDIDIPANRALLLRAWVELSAWVGCYLRSYPKSISTRKEQNQLVQRLWVKVHSATDEISTMIGSHPNQIPRGLIEAPQTRFDETFHGLGVTQSSHTPKLLAFAYKMQARCDITHLPIHFDELIRLVDNILPQLKREDPLVNEDLRDLIVMERSRDRWTPGEYNEALDTLQLGEDSPLLLGIFETDATFLENAYKQLLYETWRPPASAPSTWSEQVKMKMEPTERRQVLKNAVRIAAEGTGKEEFYQVWKKISEPWSSMDPEKAYTTLGVPKDTTEDMLLTVYTLRVQDAPSQLDRMKEALIAITESRNSSRLREFLRSGTDPGEERIVIQPDWPRGLNQLGNTCYLNSLLQYFYTIKDLRQVILSMKSEDQQLEIALKDKLSDAQLQKHRVGGRLVTRKEIERSRKFLAQLSDLFVQMAGAEANAITPSLELAKLALVTSKDEEEDEAKAKPNSGAGTSSSASTDATLVEEATTSIPGPLTADFGATSTSNLAPPASSTVLGKRPRDAEMDIEDNVDANVASKARSLRTEDSPPPDKTMRIDGPEGVEENNARKKTNEDVEMEDVEVSSVIGSAGASGGASMAGSPAPSTHQTIADTSTANQPPPLPKRQPPPLPPRKQPASDSVMMFGKQHDVSECMDNCMFQIETALLDFEGQVSSDSDKTSVVKRLFYGKMRQRITPMIEEATSQGKSTVNVKDDLFSHLPVQVSDEGFDLYDGLAGYFQDNVEFEGKKATMEVTLLDLPQVLQIQLQRVQFNRETLQPYKSQAYVKFAESLYMDRWLEDANPEKRARSKEIQSRLAACRDRINALTQEHGVSMVDALKSTAAFIGSAAVNLLMEIEGIPDELAAVLDAEAKLLEEELKSLRAEVAGLKVELESLWTDEQMAEYELTSVFIHRGSSPSWGHYFFYARNLPDKPDEWFKYNDSAVSMAKKEDVLADTTGSTANPYLLVFARKGSGVVHTVNRQT